MIVIGTEEIGALYFVRNLSTLGDEIILKPQEGSSPFEEEPSLFHSMRQSPPLQAVGLAGLNMLFNNAYAGHFCRLGQIQNAKHGRGNIGKLSAGAELAGVADYAEGNRVCGMRSER